MAELPKTWEDWVNNFSEWQDRVGFNREWLGDFDLSILFDWDRAGVLSNSVTTQEEQSGKERYKCLTKTSGML